MIWRTLTTGKVSHAFRQSTDTQALCGRLLHYSLGIWVNGKNGKKECKACVKVAAEDA